MPQQGSRIQELLTPTSLGGAAGHSARPLRIPREAFASRAARFCLEDCRGVEAPKGGHHKRLLHELFSLNFLKEWLCKGFYRGLL